MVVQLWSIYFPAVFIYHVWYNCMNLIPFLPFFLNMIVFFLVKRLVEVGGLPG